MARKVRPPLRPRPEGKIAIWYIILIEEQFQRRAWRATRGAPYILGTPQQLGLWTIAREEARSREDSPKIPSSGGQMRLPRAKATPAQEQDWCLLDRSQLLPWTFLGVSSYGLKTRNVSTWETILHASILGHKRLSLGGRIEPQIVAKN